MQIIDKNKDYYDYFSRIHGVDKTVTFDRRGSVILTQEELRDILIVEPKWRSRTQFFVLEFGFVQILFQVENISVIREEKRSYGNIPVYDGQWSVLKVFKELKHFGKKEISISSCNVKEFYME